MRENKIGLKSVAQLLDMKFFIPSYQRGYRWTEQQVKDLLEDIYDFSKKKEYRKGEFYCVQPLVVREMNEEEKKQNSLEGKWYEVIDGQQRLTTIYLILTFLKEDKLYQLNYQRGLLIKEFLKGSFYDEKIDYYYLNRAYFSIEEWFKEREKEKEKIQKVLLTYIPNDDKIKDKANNIRFIWYESVDEDPIKVFTRLNIGKISLTNAELIKALFLNRSNFEKEESTIRLRQQEIASEWDHIEYKLQNEEFWLFLNAIGDNRPTRIDFIFDLICEKNILALENEKIEAIGTDEYKTFRYFYQYFKNEDANITHCWGIVKKYFQIFQEWYDDVELYHYIGFLAEYKSISELVNKWEKATDKNSFLKYLKEEIKKIVTKNSITHQYDIEGKNKTLCKPILLFHNIQTVINQNSNQKDKYEIATFYKFPFHLYKLENWDVEHIHSSTDNPEDDVQTQREWLLNVYLSVGEELQEEIAKCLREDSNKSDDDSPNKTAIKKLFDKIKSDFSTQEEWTPEEKNRIWNYTLLDSSTNRSYGNAIFPAKRRVIISKDKGQNIAIPQFNREKKWVLKEPISMSSSFVPPCTKQVFLKYYSPTIADNNYWTKTDAEAYQNDIQECIHQLNN
ncbi:DUF262 domain-containing protein [Capnocytophaga granulosa]|jgi:hypothetical protein